MRCKQCAVSVKGSIVYTNAHLEALHFKIIWMFFGEQSPKGKKKPYYFLIFVHEWACWGKQWRRYAFKRSIQLHYTLQRKTCIISNIFMKEADAFTKGFYILSVSSESHKPHVLSRSGGSGPSLQKANWVLSRASKMHIEVLNHEAWMKKLASGIIS